MGGRAWIAKETPSRQARSQRWPISRLAWIGGGLLATVAALIVGITLVSNGASSESSNGHQYRFNITPPSNLAFSPSSASLALSPDGRRLAFTGSTEQSGLELWIQPLDSVDARKLNGAANAGQLFWSSDSRSIAFADTAADFRLKTIDVDSGAVRFRGVAQIDQLGTWHSGHGILAKVGDVIKTIPLEGGTPASVTSLDVSRGESSHRFPSFLPDGRHFVYLATSTQPEHDGIAYLMEIGSNTPVPLFRWLAYASNEAGRFEVYAAPYPSAHFKRPVSVGGGTEPAWRGDGEELFYLAPKGQLMAVPIKAGTSLEFGAPQPLFQTALSSLVNPNYTRNQYAVSRDGQRILINQPASKPSLAVATVVVGWPTALKGRSGS